jgi:hypothetical protein
MIYGTYFLGPFHRTVDHFWQTSEKNLPTGSDLSLMTISIEVRWSNRILYYHRSSKDTSDAANKGRRLYCCLPLVIYAED